MIDPVNNRIQEYNRINTQTNKNVKGGEQFDLNYGQKEENATKKDVDELEKAGVKVELSTQGGSRQTENGFSQASNSSVQKEEEISFESTIESAKKWIGQISATISRVITTIRDRLVEFWNSDSVSMEPTETVDEVSDIHDKEVKPIQNSNSAITTVANEVPKGLSKKSDLLAFYDRNGKMKKISESDRNQILRGNKNDLKG